MYTHPWCGTEITIAKVGHGRKGEPAVISAVLEDSTETRIHVQLSRYNPSNPFSMITLGCDDVVETKTFLPLKKYFNLREPRRMPKPTPSATAMPSSTSTWVASLQAALGSEPSQSPIPTGSSTPMPMESSSSTPAWDPSSYIASAPVSQAMPQHVLLKPQLVGVTLEVILNNGQEYDNKFVDVHIKHSWVRPKHPSATNDQGLLIVIQGDECGKYVRRINHLNRANGAKIILAVVHHVPKAVDTLTGEELMLSPDYLCKAVESPEDKKLNKNVMKERRQRFKSGN
ncbi:hypothetical protein BJ912DRAFT_930710 [Pholiota molesta]|nr:hypothetical protein BJ912DRAFT_930710 [Pholiota molesta]